MSRAPELSTTLATAVLECRRILAAQQAAVADDAGVLVVRDDRGRLVGAYVCDDVPVGEVHEADGPLVSYDQAAQLIERQRAAAPRRPRRRTPWLTGAPADEAGPHRRPRRRPRKDVA